MEFGGVVIPYRATLPFFIFHAVPSDDGQNDVRSVEGSLDVVRRVRGGVDLPVISFLMIMRHLGRLLEDGREVQFTQINVVLDCKRWSPLVTSSGKSLLSLDM